MWNKSYQGPIILQILNEIKLFIISDNFDTPYQPVDTLTILLGSPIRFKHVSVYKITTK